MTDLLRTALSLCLALAARSALAADPLTVEEVAEGVYVHAGVQALMSAENAGGIANLGFVVGEEAVAVIDPGGSMRQGEALLAALREVTDLPVRYVIETHAHPDHVFGAAAFPHAVVVGHERLAAALGARGERDIEVNRALIGDANDGARVLLPEEAVEDEHRIDLGGRTLLLTAWPPAHTDHDLTVLDEETGTLFAGDLLFMEHLPVVDGSIVGWLDVMDDLAEVPAERVVPGHGPAVAEWPNALGSQRDYLEGLASEVRALIAEGVPIDQAAATAGQGMAGDWMLFDQFNARNVTAAYAELEWE